MEGSLGNYKFIRNLELSKQELQTIDLVYMKTFTDEGMERDPSSRRLIPQNHWKAISREESEMGLVGGEQIFFPLDG